MRSVGTSVYGVRTPIIRSGNDLVKIVCDSVQNVLTEQHLELKPNDVVAVTEAVVAISQGNYVTVEQISDEVRRKTGGGRVGLIFPILSRNRFSTLLSGIVGGVDELIIQLSYPNDEVGNPLVSIDRLYELGITTFDKVFTSDEFYKIVGSVEHPFTGMDYIKYYLDLCGGKAKIILSNDPTTILKYTDKIINADIHSRNRTKNLLLKRGAKVVCSLSDLLNEKSTEHGYNTSYGLLGSNKSKDGVVKLFPHDCDKFVERLQAEFKKRTGVAPECMVYGDGAFKDPVGGIWELADPVVSPAFTKGLNGTPNEIKLKYVADNDLNNCTAEGEIEAKMREIISKKDKDLKNKNISLGTTPRRLTDLLGSLSDLTSGSGDKGTPVVLIKGYFDNYATK